MGSTIGTSQEVVDDFVGRTHTGIRRTRVAQVPGGRRVSVRTELDGTVALYSYRTIVAIRRPDGSFAVTTRRYGPSTGKLLGRIRSALYSASWRPDGGEHEPTTIPVLTAIPGRHGGFGIPWATSSHETLPFILWT